MTSANRPAWYENKAKYVDSKLNRMRKKAEQMTFDNADDYAMFLSMTNHLSWFQRKDGTCDLVTYPEYIRRTQKQIESGEIA